MVPNSLLAYFMQWDAHNYTWSFLSRINKNMENNENGGFPKQDKRWGKPAKIKYFLMLLYCNIK